MEPWKEYRQISKMTGDDILEVNSRWNIWKGKMYEDRGWGKVKEVKKQKYMMDIAMSSKRQYFIKIKPLWNVFEWEKMRELKIFIQIMHFSDKKIFISLLAFIT